LKKPSFYGLTSLSGRTHYYSVKFDFVDIVIARRPKPDVAISYPSKDRGCSGAKTPHDNAHSFDLDGVLDPKGDGRIGKDDVRIMSRSNFERRIEELKQDSVGEEQATLIQGIYVLRKFCIGKSTNVMMVSEEMMQQDDQIRRLLYRLLDYRIIHSAGSALTHKSAVGTYQAFVIDIGCYAHLRKLRGRFTEIDVSDSGAREKMRSSPILTAGHFEVLWAQAPSDVEGALRSEEEDTD
jgi:hypothetical protein